MRITPRFFRDILGVRITLNVILPIVIFAIMVYFTLFYKPYHGLELRSALENTCSSQECQTAVNTYFEECIALSSQEKLNQIQTISSQLLSDCINQRAGKSFF